MTSPTKKTTDIRFAFFGTPALAVVVLDELEKAGLRPQLVVTGPDEKQGRGLVLTPPPVKTWADARGIEAVQPERIDAATIERLRASEWDAFVVVAYGTILPQALLEIPLRGVLNVHPSLLPRLRGPSPVRSAILNDEQKTGVTVMLLDEEMDHGPIIAQKTALAMMWPPRASELEELLMRAGGELLAHVLPQWVAGEIDAHEQNHDVATYCEKIQKEDGLLDFTDDAYKNLLKIRALEGWPGTYAFFERAGKKMRVKIVDAHLEGDRLVIDSVKPEGKNAMPYADFARSGAKLLS